MQIFCEFSSIKIVQLLLFDMIENSVKSIEISMEDFQEIIYSGHMNSNFEAQTKSEYLAD